LGQRNNALRLVGRGHVFGRLHPQCRNARGDARLSLAEKISPFADSTNGLPPPGSLRCWPGLAASRYHATFAFKLSGVGPVGDRALGRRTFPAGNPFGGSMGNFLGRTGFLTADGMVGGRFRTGHRHWGGCFPLGGNSGREILPCSSQGLKSPRFYDAGVVGRGRTFLPGLRTILPKPYIGLRYPAGTVFVAQRQLLAKDNLRTLLIRSVWLVRYRPRGLLAPIGRPKTKIGRLPQPSGRQDRSPWC
jgi:hypothetical protein